MNMVLPSRVDLGSVCKLRWAPAGQVTSWDGGSPRWPGPSALCLILRLCGSSLAACLPALAKNSDWVDQFRVKFLGSVQVPYHKGNDVLCAAMQKVPGSCCQRHPVSPVGRGTLLSGGREGFRGSLGQERWAEEWTHST